MDKKYTLLVIGLIILGISFFLIFKEVVQPKLNNRTVPEVVGTNVNASDVDFDFKYPSGVEGYVMIEPPVATTSLTLKKAYLMFEYQRYLEYQNAEKAENHQTPPAVSVFVFALPEMADQTISREEELLQWMTENPQYTSFNRKIGEVKEEVVDGVFAYAYSTEGIYGQDFYVMSYRGNVYVFAAQYQDSNDRNIAMFKNLINSVTFN